MTLKTTVAITEDPKGKQLKLNQQLRDHGLEAPDMGEDGYVQEQGIIDNSNDPKARAIARSLLGQDDPVVSSVKPLERWSGGSIKDPGNSRQVSLDYPDVWVGVFPARD